MKEKKRSIYYITQSNTSLKFIRAGQKFHQWSQSPQSSQEPGHSPKTFGTDVQVWYICTVSDKTDQLHLQLRSVEKIVHEVHQPATAHVFFLFSQENKTSWLENKVAITEGIYAVAGAMQTGHCVYCM